MISGARAQQGPATTGGPIRAGFSRGPSRAWATKSGRRRLIFLVVLVVVVVVMGLGVLMFSSLSGESQSYRDGYTAGGPAYGFYGSEGAEQACKTMELRGSGLGGLRPGDNSTQWLKGCVAGFNATQADNY